MLDRCYTQKVGEGAGPAEGVFFETKTYIVVRPGGLKLRVFALQNAEIAGVSLHASSAAVSRINTRLHTPAETCVGLYSYCVLLLNLILPSTRAKLHSCARDTNPNPKKSFV